MKLIFKLIKTFYKAVDLECCIMILTFGAFRARFLKIQLKVFNSKLISSTLWLKLYSVSPLHYQTSFSYTSHVERCKPFFPHLSVVRGRNSCFVLLLVKFTQFFWMDRQTSNYQTTLQVVRHSLVQHLNLLSKY